MVLTLLIIDDNRAFRTVARAVLGDGFRIVGEAADARSGIALARDLDPDIVLLDVELPDGDGFDVAASLAAHGARPAVVLTSGRGRSELGVLIDESPARGFVEKDRLSVEALCALLDRR